MDRPSWDTYFMNLAKSVSERSTCDRAHVGAVIVRNRSIVSTGYNGSVSGAKHCDDVGHLMVDGHCVRTIHAEQNAIAQAAKLGNSVDGCTIYITHFPCLNCFKLLLNSGITTIIHDKILYTDENILPITIEILNSGKEIALYPFKGENNK